MNDTKSCTRTFLCLEMGNCATNLRMTGLNNSENPENMECDSVESPVQKNSASLHCPSSSERCYKPPRASFRELGSLEETFFDSHLWLDSDCEDYFSVNGDVTPSVNNTPPRRSIVGGESPQSGGDLEANDASKPRNKSSQNKPLIDLFHESFNSEGQGLEENQNSRRMPEARPANTTICYLPPKPQNKSSFVSMVNSVCNGRRSQKRHSDSGTRKKRQPAKCCLTLPNLARSLSLSERK